MFFIGHFLFQRKIFWKIFLWKRELTGYGLWLFICAGGPHFWPDDVEVSSTVIAAIEKLVNIPFLFENIENLISFPSIIGKQSPLTAQKSIDYPQYKAFSRRA